jgi:DNA modification methylase
MTPTVTLLNGDSLELLNSEAGFRASEGGPLLRADACVTDPPYGFDFAGSDDWDSFSLNSKVKGAGDNAAVFAKFTQDWSYRLLTDILKPGSHVLAFSADRTIDLVGRGLRQAGYDIVRLLFWLYASGQVKNPNDTRPGCEPIFVGRVPTDKSLTKLYKETGRGQLNAQVWKSEDGRHPTNILVDQGTIDLDEDLAELVRKSKTSFFVPKCSPKERDSYCGDMPLVQKDSKLSHMSTTVEKAAARQDSGVFDEEGNHKAVMAQNYHPTVKPIEVMRRLIRLVSRPGHTIIDPFMGSGTTGIAAVLEGRNFIGIEREAKYFEIASTRINNALAEVTK